MAEFEMDSRPSGGGQPPTPKGGKKGFKINKPMLYIGGAVIIIAFLLLRGRGAGSDIEEEQEFQNSGMSYDVQYPTNSADVQSQLSNNSDIVQSQVDQQLNQFQTDIGQQNKEFIDAIQDEYDDKFKALEARDKRLAGQIDKFIDSHPSPGMTLPSKPKPDKKLPTKPKPKTGIKPKPKAKPKPKPKPKPKAKPKTKTINVRKGDTLSELSQKHTGSGSKKAYTALAKLNKIKNPDKIKAGQKIKVPVKPQKKKR